MTPAKVFRLHVQAAEAMEFTAVAKQFTRNAQGRSSRIRAVVDATALNLARRRG